MEQSIHGDQVLPRSDGSREQFLRKVGLGGTAAFLGLLAVANNPLHASAAGARKQLAALSDIDILNFALSLEHLEAEFYKEAMASGKLMGLSQSLLSEIYGDEVSHVVVVSTAIALAGGTPVAKQSHYNFGDMSKSGAILKTAEILEMTGVGAYTGAAPLIKSKVVLAAAASIEQIEARHYAAIRYVRDELPAPSAFGPSLTVAQVQAATKPIFGM